MNPALVCIPTYNERENVEAIARAAHPRGICTGLRAKDAHRTTARRPGGLAAAARRATAR